MFTNFLCAKIAFSLVSNKNSNLLFKIFYITQSA